MKRSCLALLVALLPALAQAQPYDTRSLSRADTAAAIAARGPYITSQSLGVAGWRVWSDGLIEQWGTVAGNGSADTAVTFAKPCSVAVYSLLGSINAGQTSTSFIESVSFSAPALTGFTGYPRYSAQGSTGRSSSPYSWRAICR